MKYGSSSSSFKNLMLMKSSGFLTLAAGRRFLERTYGKGRWRKMKGEATVQFADGTVSEAEIHWFKAHGVGRKDFKIKRVLR